MAQGWQKDTCEAFRVSPGLSQEVLALALVLPQQRDLRDPLQIPLPSL